MRKTTLQLVLLFLLFTFNSVSSQQIIMVKDSASDGTIKFARVDGGIKPSTSKETKDFLKHTLKSEVGVDFYLYKTITDDLGMTHEKYQQVFNGIKVEFCEFIIHKDKLGKIVSLNGEFVRIPKNSKTKPVLTFESALEKHELSRKKGKYSVKSLDTGKSVESPISQGGTNYEVVFVKGNDEVWHLAYKANLLGETIFDNFYGYIDCETSEMIKVQPLVYQVNATGTATTMYSGNRTITTDFLSNAYHLQESNRGSTTTAIQTWNFNRNPAYYVSDVTSGIAAATDFMDNDNNWTTTEFNNANRDNAALDAHWGAEMTFDYFNIVHQRKSFDNNNGTIRNYVHVQTRDGDNSFTPTNMDNAFWLQSERSMFYGDGLFFNPTVSLDICAHELGHAVCNSSIGNNGAGLTYEKESGALNESLSDIWGSCVEQWATTGKQTWICGEDVFWGGSRSMNNPNLFNQPDTYLGTNWVNTTGGCTPSERNDRCGVHTNSGVGNFWFFLLSQGGSGTNDIGNNYFVDGIGIEKAAKIVYKMETAYLLSTSGYLDARTYSINTAIDYYGANSQEVASVTNAWYAVGVGARYQYTISGPSQVCGQATYTVDAAGATVVWSATPSGVVSLQPNGSSVTLTKVGSGLITLSAKVNNSITVTKDIWVGLQASFSGSASVNYLKTGTWYSNASCGAEPYIYQWWLRKANSGVASMCVSNDPEITLRSVAQGTAKLAQSAKPPIVNQPVSYTIFYMFLRVTDASGFQYDTPEQQIYAYGKVDLVPALLLRMTDSVQVSDVDQVKSMEIFPNPASGEVQISINKASSASLKAVSSNISNNSQNSYSVNVVDIYGSIVYTDTKVGELFTIPISTLRNGVYNVIVSDGTNTYQNKLIVKH